VVESSCDWVAESRIHTFAYSAGEVVNERRHEFTPMSSLMASTK
jgi:hypothetical protein